MPARRTTLDPKLDIVFWMLFGEERNRALLISLLTAVLQPGAPIDVLQVLRSEPERSVTSDKAIALDLRIRLATGEQVDIEMQTQRRRALPARLLYYWSRLYSAQLARGDDYAALRRAAVVVFTNFSMLAGRRFHSLVRLHESHDAELFTDQLAIHVLELPKLDLAPREDERLLVLWGRFLSAGTDEQLERLTMEHPVFKQAKQALDDLSADPRARLLAEQREDAILLHHAELIAAREEAHADGLAVGKAEGRAQGRAEGKATTLRLLLASKFGAVPESAAQRLAFASEPELDGWLERLLSASRIEEVFGD